MTVMRNRRLRLLLRGRTWNTPPQEFHSIRDLKYSNCLLSGKYCGTSDTGGSPILYSAFELRLERRSSRGGIERIVNFVKRSFVVVVDASRS